MALDLSFPFDDVPLFSDSDSAGAQWTAGYVEGVATIAVDDHGDWEIHSVQIDVTAGRNIFKRVFLSSEDDLCRRISAHLTAHEHERIEERVSEALCDAGIARFDPLREHGTLNRLQQGI